LDAHHAGNSAEGKCKASGDRTCSARGNFPTSWAFFSKKKFHVRRTGQPLRELVKGILALKSEGTHANSAGKWGLVGRGGATSWRTAWKAKFPLILQNRRAGWDNRCGGSLNRRAGAYGGDNSRARQADGPRFRGRPISDDLSCRACLRLFWPGLLRLWQSGNAAFLRRGREKPRDGSAIHASQ